MRPTWPAPLPPHRQHPPPGGALVFANTPDSAEEAFASLADHEPNGCALYHKNIPPAERARVLEEFRQGKLRALVCTGLASRGIDLANVTHVIQYECAANAVEFMHRIGRTARAGNEGTATTFYDDERAELVEALKEACEGGHPSARPHCRRTNAARVPL